MKLLQICTIVFDTPKDANIQSLAKWTTTCRKCNPKYLYPHQAGDRAQYKLPGNICQRKDHHVVTLKDATGITSLFTIVSALISISSIIDARTVFHPMLYSLQEVSADDER